MKIHLFSTKQVVPIDLATAWRFFSNPANLSKITPPQMKFEVLSDLPDKVYAGMIIQYQVKPLFGVPVNWVTEITHVAEPHFFVDEQRFGPYKFWHHQHHFREHPEGVEMEDVVHYALPIGVLGSIANQVLVKKKLNEIFSFRKTVLEVMFGI